MYVCMSRNASYVRLQDGNNVHTKLSVCHVVFVCTCWKIAALGGVLSTSARGCHQRRVSFNFYRGLETTGTCTEIPEILEYCNIRDTSPCSAYFIIQCIDI